MHARLTVDMKSARASSSPLAWIEQAHLFLEAAASIYYRHITPALVNCGYALELALKGFLLQKGAADLPTLKKTSHDLARLTTMAEGAGLPPQMLTAEELLHLGQVFNGLSGSDGRYRAGIYPVEGSFGYTVHPGFFTAVQSVVVACSTAVVGPRDLDSEAQARRQRHENFGHDPHATHGSGND